MNREQVKAALAWLNAEKAKDAAAAEEAVIGWTIKIVGYNEEHGTLHGVYSDPISAARDAERWRRQLNDPGSDEFKLLVTPIATNPFGETP